MLLTSAFLKENSAISFEECVLMFKVFTTATRRLRVNLTAFTQCDPRCPPSLSLSLFLSLFLTKKKKNCRKINFCGQVMIGSIVLLVVSVCDRVA